MKKILVAGALALACSSSMSANELPTGQIYGGIGTTGPVLGYRHNINEFFAVRGDLSGFHYNKDFKAGSIDYKGKAKIFNVGIYGDYFPFGGNFFISAGIAAGKNEIKAHAKPNQAGTIRINGETYRYGSGDSIDAKAKYASVRPYIGTGWASRSSKGLGFVADIGVTYGKLDLDVATSGNINNIPGFQANLNTEKSKLEDKLKNFKFYPVIKIGVSYAF